ncbi:sodium:solute symporter family protein [Candidatus Bathyarchaeota archaeon]|nr:sodium:solute symporter family protein [Candidatus Bathyarchaeota archaeon]
MVRILTIADWLLLAVYLGGLAVYGWLFKRFIKTKEDYFIAGRAAPFWLSGIALAAIALDASDMMAPFALSYGAGLWGLWWFIGCVLGSFLLAGYIVPAFFRKKVITNTTYLEYRFEPGIRLYAAWTQVIQRSVVMAGAITSISFLLEIVLGAPFWHAVLIAVAISAFMTVAGGRFAVMASEVFAILFGVVMAWYLLSLGIGGIGWSKFVSDVVPWLHWVNFPKAYNPAYPNWVWFIGITILTLPYSIINQEYLAKTLSASSEYDARRGLMFPNILLWILWCLPLSILGNISYFLYPPGSFTGPVDRSLFFIIRDLAPAGMIGLLVATFFAASQDIGGTAQSVASLITIDTYQRFIKKDASEEDLVKIGRILTAVIMIVPLVWIPLMLAMPVVATVYGMVTGMAIVPTVVPYIVGPLTRFWSRRSAIVGCLVAAIFGFIFRMWGKDLGLPLLIYHPWTCGIPTIIIGFVVMVVWSLIENSMKGPIPETELEGLLITSPGVKAAMLQNALATRLTEIGFNKSGLVR